MYVSLQHEYDHLHGKLFIDYIEDKSVSPLINSCNSYLDLHTMKSTMQQELMTSEQFQEMCKVAEMGSNPGKEL